VNSVFADTAFYVAIINERDALHLAAMEFSKQYRWHIVTAEYVLVELGNWFARSAHRNRFGYLIQQVFDDAKTTIVPAERSLLLEGIDLYVSRADKDWSLTDCVSFIVMRRFALTDALTDDHHFEQAEFNLLLS
jgi:predicted nucleic acid-binding protein